MISAPGTLRGKKKHIKIFEIHDFVTRGGNTAFCVTAPFLIQWNSFPQKLHKEAIPGRCKTFPEITTLPSQNSLVSHVC